MRTELFDYHLPPELIARYPAKIRRKCRMLVLDRAAGSVTHAQFEDLPLYLQPGDLTVFNNTKVIPARLLGHKAETGGKIEIFLLRKLDCRRWEALVRPNARCKPGTVIEFDKTGKFTVIAEGDAGPGKRIIRLKYQGSLERVLRQYGHTPLPPYLNRPAERADVRDYQTVFARKPGAVASPTASLHFDRVILERLKRTGVKRAEITLHVGEGSFRPIKTETVAAHRLEAEEFDVPRAAIKRIIAARRGGHRVVAVGTTVARTLETLAAWNHEPVETWAGSPGQPKRTYGASNLFIAAPYEFRLVDALLTNFHLPRSSLLVLVSAFAERELVLAAYRQAVEKKYRFYSYGDCMLLL